MERKLAALLCAVLSLSIVMPVHAQEVNVEPDEVAMAVGVGAEGTPELEESKEASEINGFGTSIVGIDSESKAFGAAPISGLCGDNVTWSLNETTGVLTISGTGAMSSSSCGQSVVSSSNQHKVVSVVIQQGVTSIGSEAFCGCTNMTSILIPNSVTSIGSWAFENCRGLSNVTFPESVTQMGSSVFAGCSNLNELTVQGNPTIRLTADGTLTISGTGSMEKYTDYVPYGELKSKVTRGVVEPGITNIKSAFSGCENLTSASIANTVTSMNYAFHDCTSLTSVTIPNSVTSMEHAFDGCSGLIDITIPNSVTSMEYAFSGCTGLTSITIPNSVTNMGSSFSGCTGLTSVTIPNSVSTSYRAFENCVNLKNVTLELGIKRISWSEFAGCSGLENVDIPRTVTEIDDNAFNGCRSLVSINIPDSITNISYEAFKNCTKLASFTASKATIGRSCFEGCTSLQTVKCRADSSYDIPKEAFKNCTALKEVTINGCGRSYGWSSSIDSPDSIDEGAFTGCINLTKVTIPDTVKNIDIHAFRYCDKLQSIVVHGEPRTLSDYTVKEYNDAFKKTSFANEPHDETSEVTSTPSEWSTGTRTYTCKICGDKREEEIPKLVDDTVDPSTLHCKWYNKGGKSYWYEHGVRQGTYDDPNGVMGDGSIRGREICDMESAGWYWLDSVYDGAKAINKEVWMPYIYQQEKSWSDAEIKMNAQASGNMAAQVERDIKAGTGKWVRYDSTGAMYKGWYTVEGQQASIYPNQAGNTYYYDPKTGLMAKGDLIIDGVNYHFDEITGVLQR